MTRGAPHRRLASLGQSRRQSIALGAGGAARGDEGAIGAEARRAVGHEADAEPVVLRVRALMKSLSRRIRSWRR
jgi:hypothetical protein